MASVIITSLFTRGGNPATDLEIAGGGGFPIMRIWDIVDGTPAGDAYVNQFVMIPVEQGANDDGFYKYEFLDIPDGYNPTKTYVIRVDGGPTIPPSERFQVTRLSPPESALAAQAIADAVWDEPRASHISVGSTGEALSQIKADITNVVNKLYLDADSVLDVVQLMLKLEAGRTKIDPTAKTLTVYDENCTSVLRVFNLYDSTGTPSVTDVCERVPKIKGVSDGTTITDVCP